MLQGKKILIGISGSIAAYKTITLVRLLVKAGAIVKVVMTTKAKDFASPLVLSTLSKNEVLIDIESNNSWANHVQLGRWADVMLIAPLSCNTLSKMTVGACDNLLMAVYLSATCPICVAPAMDEDMWHHPSTQKNIDTIKQFGNKVIPVNLGELASGLYGLGRMAEPEEIISFLISTYFRNSLLKKNVLVTAGPTYEAIDPVRYIANHSSGKMGFSIAEQAFLQGANVTLITGPTNCSTSFAEIEVVEVVSSKEMYETVMSRLSTAEVVIMSAAVADYKPKVIVDQKIKKGGEEWSLVLEKTDDILLNIGTNKKNNQVLIGFALETTDEKENALKKLKSKNLDAIILNSLNSTNKVFGSNFNCITIIDKDEKEYIFETKSKSEVAEDIISFIISKNNL
jgi:phosphopantothenoylcysteine decarboxylase / phosphopantothenate---cysteine ligase